MPAPGCDMRRTEGSGARAIHGRRKRQARKGPERTQGVQRGFRIAETERRNSGKNFGARVRAQSGDATPGPVIQSLPTGGSPGLRASSCVRGKAGFGIVGRAKAFNRGERGERPRRTRRNSMGTGISVEDSTIGFGPEWFMRLQAIFVCVLVCPVLSFNLSAW